MRNILKLQLLLLLHCLSCRETPDEKIEYIKIVDFWRPDTVNIYNKGTGLGMFCYYEPARDSFVLRMILDIDSLKFKTIVAKVKGTHVDDSLYLLVEALGKYKDGYTFDTTYRNSDATYCGPSYYVEYKKGNKIHYNYFILDGDDTLSRFSYFYNRINYTELNYKSIDNNLVNKDWEVVNAMTRMGIYDKAEIPYIPPICSEGIDKRKIYGAWRALSKDRDHKNTFYRITFSDQNEWISESVYAGVLRPRRIVAKFSIDSRDTMLVLKRNGVTLKHKILMITDSCMTLNERGTIVRYARL